MGCTIPVTSAGVLRRIASEDSVKFYQKDSTEKRLAWLCSFGNSKAETDEALDLINNKKIFIHWEQNTCFVSEIHGDSFLHLLANNSNVFDTAIADALVKHGINVNAEGPFDWTALHQICWKSHAYVIEGVQFLLDHGANLHHRSRHGYNAFDYAVRRHNDKAHPELVQFLIKKNAKINEVSWKLLTPLSLLCKQGEYASLLVACILLKANANPNRSKYEDESPLESALFPYWGRVSEPIIRLLLGWGADPYEKSKRRETEGTPLYDLSDIVRAEYRRTKHNNAIRVWQSLNEK